MKSMDYKESQAHYDKLDALDQFDNDNESITGYSVEGFPVEKSALRFRVTFQKVEWNGTLFAVYLECNKTPELHRRPYCVFRIGTLMVQVGWLF